MIDREKTGAEARVWFDKLWADGDPWDRESNAYEIAKYEAQVALLDADRGPGRQFGRALQIGCAVGTVTRRIAPRCESVVAIDIAQPAIATASQNNAAPNKPWVIRSYHDLFRNVGFVPLQKNVFRDSKKGADIEALVWLLDKGPDPERAHAA